MSGFKTALVLTGILAMAFVTTPIANAQCEGCTKGPTPTTVPTNFNAGQAVQSNLNNTTPSMLNFVKTGTLTTPQGKDVITTKGAGGLDNLDNIVNRTDAQSTVGSQISLQQFVTENPGAKGLADVLKSKGMSDAEIVAMLQKGKDEWLGNSSTPSLPGSGVTSTAVLGKMSDTQLHADIFAFMAIFQKMAQDMRQTARLDRDASLQAQVSTLEAAAEQMKKAAEMRFQAAIIQGASQIGAGALQVGGGAASLKTLTPQAGLDQMKQAMSATDLAAANKTLTDKMSGLKTEQQNITQIGQQFLTGAGQLISGASQMTVSQKEAEKAKLDAQAKIMEEARNKANDTMQQMQDVIRDIRDKLSAIQQAAVETNRGIARNI